MIADRNTIKSWFQRGMKPLATQFAVWIDSYWHKTDTIPTASIDGLENTLNKKAEQTDVNNLYADFIIHRADDAKHKTEAEQDKLNNLAANPNATYATHEELEQLSDNSMIIIPADFTKETAEMEAEIIATVQERLTDGTLFKKPVYLLYKWKKDYTSEDAPVYYALVSKSDEKRTEGSTNPNVQMYFNSSIVVISADAAEYPAAYCIMLNIRGEQVRIAYQQYADLHPVYAISLTEDGNGIINSADKNWYSLYKELMKGNRPQVSLKTPDSGMYCPATYEFSSVDESLASPIYSGRLEISYVKETEGRQELWVETRVFTDLSAATGTYKWENYLKKFTLTGSGELTDTKDCITTFPDQDTRTNIASGEKHSVLFGKIKRWFSDLKNVAFTGRAADISQDADNRLVTDAEKANWGDKYTRSEVDNKDDAVLQQAKEYAAQKIAEIVGSAPETLDTLNELAAALGNDPNFETSIMALIGSKADLVHTHTSAQITDFPASLPANGGNADTVGGFSLDNLGKIINSAIADIDNTPGFFSGFWNTATAGTKPGSYGTLLQVANKYGLPDSGKEVWVFQIAHVHGIDRPYWRRQYNNGGWSSWKQLALTDDIPSSLPANGGNADTVGGISPLFIMQRNGLADINADSILGASQYGFGYNSNGFPVSGSFISFGGFVSDDYTTQIIASYKGDQIYFRTYDGDLKKWYNWQRIALHDRVLGNAGEQTLSNGRLNMLVSTPEHVVMFKDANGNIGYIGFGAYPTKDLQIMNYASGKFINIASDGKLYYDNKELAFKEDAGASSAIIVYSSGHVAENMAAYNAIVAGNYSAIILDLGGGNIATPTNMAISAPEIQFVIDNPLIYSNSNVSFNEMVITLNSAGSIDIQTVQVETYTKSKIDSLTSAGETLMLDTNNTPEAKQRNIAVYTATYAALSTYTEIPRIGLIAPAELGYSAGQRLWTIGAAQVDGGLKLTFCGLNSVDIVQYIKAVVNSAGVLVITPIPH